MKKNKFDKQSTRDNTLPVANSLPPQPNEEVTVRYLPEAPKGEEGKEIHPRRPAPPVPEGPDVPDPDPSPAVDI